MTAPKRHNPPRSPKIVGHNPKILLIYPFSPNPNNSPPLGMAYVAAVFRERGCEARCVDAAARRVDNGDDKVQNAIRDFRPDAVGLSVIVGNVRHAYELIERYLSQADIPIIIGGPHATVLPEEAIQHGGDIVVRGEAEETTSELVEWLRGERDLDSIDGISYSTEIGYKQNTERAIIQDLDALPLPAHDLFDPADYTDQPERWSHFGKLISSRGCPNRCSFCANPVFGRRFRHRSKESVIEEISMLQNCYGIERFEFLDDAFTANRARMLELAHAIKMIPVITFSCVTRLENLDDETIPALRAAGLYRAYIGVESAREETLKKIHKNIDLNKLAPALELLKKNGVESSLFFMFGFPWETAEQMMETNRFIEELSVLATYFSEGGVVTPYPGSQIYEEYRDVSGFKNWWLTGWQPSEGKLHKLQPYYFFDYDDEQKKVIREALDFILDHNRQDILDKQQLLAKLKEAEVETERLTGIIYELEEQVRDGDRQLREMWAKSPREKAKKFWKKITGGE